MQQQHAMREAFNVAAVYERNKRSTVQFGCLKSPSSTSPTFSSAVTARQHMGVAISPSPKSQFAQLLTTPCGTTTFTTDSDEKINETSTWM